MGKDKIILEFIEKLKSIIDFEQVQIVDYWEADPFAIGLQKKKKMIYLNSVNTIVGTDIIFDYDLELCDDLGNCRVIKEGRNITQTEVISVLQDFFQV